MKKILLVSGDSYTDPNWLSEFHPELDTSWPKWPEIVAKELVVVFSYLIRFEEFSHLPTIW